MTNAEIDRLIIEACDNHFRKVAAIMCRVDKKSNLFSKPWGHRRMTKRLRTLVRRGKIDAAGNIFNWRASEVKLSRSGSSALAERNTGPSDTD
jgi:hypothetical protein